MPRNSTEVDEYFRTLSADMLRRLLDAGTVGEIRFARMFGVQEEAAEVRWDIAVYSEQDHSTVMDCLGISLPEEVNPEKRQLREGVFQGLEMNHFREALKKKGITPEQLPDSYARFLIRGQSVKIPLARAMEVYFSPPEQGIVRN